MIIKNIKVGILLLVLFFKRQPRPLHLLIGKKIKVIRSFNHHDYLYVVVENEKDPNRLMLYRRKLTHCIGQLRIGMRTDYYTFKANLHGLMLVD
jgi:hypothetical protein